MHIILQILHSYYAYTKHSIQKTMRVNFDHSAESGSGTRDDLRMSHVNVVQLQEIIDDPRDDNLYLIFEGLPGGQLMEWNEDSYAYSVRLLGHLRNSWVGESFHGKILILFH